MTSGRGDVPQPGPARDRAVLMAGYHSGRMLLELPSLLRQREMLETAGPCWPALFDAAERLYAALVDMANTADRFPRWTQGKEVGHGE